MGLYNLPGTIEHVTHEEIQRGTCPICKQPNIEPLICDGSMDSFDYRCNFCKKVISISGVVLGSDDYWAEYSKNSWAQTELIAEVQNYPEKVYPLYSETMSFFLGKLYDQDSTTYRYEDWKNGLIAGDPQKYKSISREELIKINLEQKKSLKSLWKFF
ncbi:MAG: hypothetical protein KF763_18485 [Cyclobacteriaceae bacterium]|nr:hypothetical protein [Cyclobacteriaceae bacterium]